MAIDVFVRFTVNEDSEMLAKKAIEAALFERLNPAVPIPGVQGYAHEVIDSWAVQPEDDRAETDAEWLLRQMSKCDLRTLRDIAASFPRDRDAPKFALPKEG